METVSNWSGNVIYAAERVVRPHSIEEAQDLAVPDQTYSFGTVEAAQARGDFGVLAERDRRALRIHLGTHVAAGLTRLESAIREILA